MKAVFAILAYFAVKSSFFYRKVHKENVQFLSVCGTLRHGNNLLFFLRVSFVPFVSLWLILFEPQGTKIHEDKSAIIGIL